MIIPRGYFTNQNTFALINKRIRSVKIPCMLQEQINYDAREIKGNAYRTTYTFHDETLLNEK